MAQVSDAGKDTATAETGASASPDTAAAGAPATGGTAVAETSSAAPSLLASADAGKHAGAKPDAAAGTDGAKGDTKTGASPESTSAGSGEKTPSSDGGTADGTGGTEGTKPDASKPEAAKPDAAKAEPGKAEAKPGAESTAETKADAAAETPPAPPTYDALKLPEGVQLDGERVKLLDKILGDTELATKADHGAMTAMRQQLADLWIQEAQRIVSELQAHQRDVWNRINEQRINEIKNDPELGGNRIDTTMGNAKYALETMCGLTKDEAGKLIEVMDAGGLSNHRLMIKALNGIYERLREPGPIDPNLPSVRSTPGQRNWYGTVDGAAAA